MTIAAIRHNNPGNVSLPIKGWNGGGSIVGISGQPGYASFPDMNTGTAALKQRVSTYIDGRGLTTISKLNSVYAEDTNWASGVSRGSGIGANDPLDTSNTTQMNSLLGGIVKQETGSSASSLGIDFSGGLGGTGGDPTATADPGATPVATGTYDMNAGAVYSWTGDPKTDPAYIASQSTTAADKAGSSVKASGEGKATDVPTAIVTAGNQQALTMANALKAIASGAAAANKATNATETANQGTFLGWLGNRMLQVMVFVVAAIFLLIGLYMFSGNKVAIMPSPA